MKPVLLTLLLLASASAPALADTVESAPDRTGEPIGEIDFSQDPGTMTPRYLRALDLKVGDRPTREDFERAIERLQEFKNLERVGLSRKGPVVKVQLEDRPSVGVGVVPLPVVSRVALSSYIEDWHVGASYLTGYVQGAYDWDTLAQFNPRTGIAVGEALTNNYWNMSAYAGAMILDDTKLLLSGRGIWSDLPSQAAVAWDPRALTQGPAAIVGPELRYDNANSPWYPTLGTRVRVGSYMGLAPGMAPGDFFDHSAEIQRYIPLGDGGTLVTSLSAEAERGEVPWNFKVRAGGTTGLRGYDDRRFMGDQLLSGSIEWRQRLAADLVPTLAPHVGVATDSVDPMFKGFGLYGALFLDVARAWDSRQGPQFPQDMRPAAGGYLALSMGRWMVGRLEVASGVEGPYVGLAAGLPWDW